MLLFDKYAFEIQADDNKEYASENSTELWNQLNYLIFKFRRHKSHGEVGSLFACEWDKILVVIII